MLETTTLQTPRSGQSRFSKALPAPPPLPPPENGTNLKLMPTPTYTHNPAPTLPAHTQTRTPSYTHTQTYMSGPVTRRPVSPPSAGLPLLKQLPPIDLGPPLPPPKEFEKGILDWDTPMATASAFAKPLSSPLPPLPQNPGPPPLMSIPRRRPVGGPAQAQSPTVTLAPAPAPSPIPASTAVPSLAPSPAPASAPEIISPNPLPSPVTSLSSLLSAYTDHTSESTPRSSTNSTNDTPGTKDSYSDVSPNQEGSRGTDSPTLPVDLNVQSATKDGGSQPPPPPLKDPRPERQQPQTQPTNGHQNGSPISDNSPTEQLWRRRSVKSDKNIAISELKLTSSNGSTVASGQPSISSQLDGAPSGASSAYSGSLPSNPPAQTESSAPPPQVRVPLPKSRNAGLPGKNVRPVASRQQINEEENMGQLASRLKNKDSGNGGYGKSEAVAPQQHMMSINTSKPLPSINAPPTITRLPTPEYEHNETRSALSNTIVSPVSPASSPELPVDANRSISPASPPVGVNSTNQAFGYKSDNAGLNVPRQPVGLPSSPAANRGQNRPVNQPFPTRSSSKAGSPQEARQPATEVPVSLQVGKQREAPPRPTNPEYLRTISETGSAESDQTLKTKENSPSIGASLDASLPERQAGEDEEETMTDNPGAALFPRDWFTPIPEDGIMDPPPLKDANRQRYNPIACGTCGVRDRNSDAYICSACHLNICANCSGNLRRCRGNLRQLLEQIKGRGAHVDQDDRTVTLTQATHDGEGDHMGGRSFERETLGGQQHIQ